MMARGREGRGREEGGGRGGGGRGGGGRRRRVRFRAWERWYGLSQPDRTAPLAGARAAASTPGGRPGTRYAFAMLLLVDLDGVVYRGAAPIPGVAAVLADRAARGDTVVYVTNNSMHYRADYVTRLTALGAPVTADRVVSRARATALYLGRPGPAGPPRPRGRRRRPRARVPRRGLDVVTAAHAASRLAQEGLDGWEAAGEPDAVVVGLDPQFTYQKLAVAGGLRPSTAHGSWPRTVIPSIRPSTGRGPGAGRSSPRSRPVAGDAGLDRQARPAPPGDGRQAAGGTAREAVMIGDGLATDLRGRARARDPLHPDADGGHDARPGGGAAGGRATGGDGD